LTSLTVVFSGSMFAAITDDFGGELEAPETDVTNKKVPSFTLKNISDEDVLLEDMRNKNLVMLFFSSKCPYSIKSAKYFNELLKDNTNVKFLAICLDGEIGNVAEGGKTQKQAAKSFGKKYLKDIKDIEILLADDTFRTDYSRFFGVSSIQTTPLHLFVDGDARCKTYIKGSTTKDDLKTAIKKLTE